ncbi:vWA domain-containing protein [Vibrio diazotrophicus]|uniref:vWA domain-containing protein n=1 Tax=Vibrio diazotrophicus TaxID=685 RepID=UPI00142D6AF3|nr:VWA domain-containing protein [Vibrio diazotrophicus]NIY92156.1 VWA domain-containing protein [Vibrio diazotrophicus]
MSDFEFLAPLWLLALIPLAAIVFWLSTHKQSQGLIANHIASALGIENRNSTKSVVSLIALSWFVAVIALAGPSFEKQTRPSYTNSNARILVMDMSLSLYATDIKPNRLTQARYKALDLLKGWNEGSTGLVAYAGDAYTVSPLTSDSATIANLLPNLSPDIMPYQGANAASGVKLAIEMLKNAGLARGELILLTDDLDEQEQSDIESELSGTHFKLVILGIGSAAGAPITLSDGSLLKTDNGQTVVAKTNFETMQSLARSVNGVFTPYQANGQDVARILSEQGLQQDVSKKNEKKTLTENVNNGYWLLPLLVIPALLLFRRGLIFVLVITTGFSVMSPDASAASWLDSGSPWKNSNQQAMEAFNNKDYQSASEQFIDPEWQGVARYQNKDFKGAIESFSKVENPSSRTQYNLANAYAQNGDLEKAKELYQQVLQQDPNNQDAKHNLEVVEKAQKQQQQQSQSRSDSGQSQNDSSKQPDSQSSQQSDPQQSQAQKQQSAQDNNSQGKQSKDSEQESKDADENANKGKETDQQTDAQAKAQGSKQDEQPEQDSQPDEKLTATTSTTTENIDPELRKLEQVESARDPSQLLRAQLILQANGKQPPQTDGKKW